MPTNFYMYFVAALIPMVVGAIYYHPKLIGSAWMKENKFTEENLKGGNMILIFGLSYLFSVLLAFIIGEQVIHQGGVFQTMMPEVTVAGSEAQAQFNSLMETYGNNFRTFGHGALHGALVGIIFVGTIIGTNALFERRSWKYCMIHIGYWTISFTLMGGLLCQTLTYAPL